MKNHYLMNLHILFSLGVTQRIIQNDSLNGSWKKSFHYSNLELERHSTNLKKTKCTACYLSP